MTTLPDAALPQPWSTVSRPTRIHREYPGVIKGRVTITGPDYHDTVALVDGVLDVEVPPGTYELVAAVRNQDGSTDTGTATVVI